MEKSIFVTMTTEKLSLDQAYAFVDDDAHGAINIFTGVVRNHHQGKQVTGITYDAHDCLAENVLQEICIEAQNQWADTKIYVAHFKGELAIGGVSIVIAVSSAHRAEGYDTNRYLIEEIKKRLPVWKQEHYLEGKSEWLPGHSLAEKDEKKAC